MIAVAGKKRPTRIRDSPNAIIPSTGPAISRCASRNTLILATTSTRTLSKLRTGAAHYCTFHAPTIAGKQVPPHSSWRPSSWPPFRWRTAYRPVSEHPTSDKWRRLHFFAITKLRKPEHNTGIALQFLLQRLKMKSDGAPLQLALLSAKQPHQLFP